jgi:hypothetical protein
MTFTASLHPHQQFAETAEQYPITVREAAQFLGVSP